MRVKPEAVASALWPVIGPPAGDETLCRNAAACLDAYRAGDDLDRLADALQRVLFNELYRLLGYRMSYRLPDGSVRRILAEDLPAAADAAMGALLDTLPVCEGSFALLRERAMRNGSLSAMRILLRRYAGSLPPMERQLLERIIAENEREENRL